MVGNVKVKGCAMRGEVVRRVHFYFGDGADLIGQSLRHQPLHDSSMKHPRTDTHRPMESSFTSEIPDWLLQICFRFVGSCESSVVLLGVYRIHTIYIQ